MNATYLQILLLLFSPEDTILSAALLFCIFFRSFSISQQGKIATVANGRWNGFEMKYDLTSTVKNNFLIFHLFHLNSLFEKPRILAPCRRKSTETDQIVFNCCICVALKPTI